jgi:hypothetical protein
MSGRPICTCGIRSLTALAWRHSSYCPHSKSPTRRHIVISANERDISAIASYEAELRAAGNNPELLRMCAEGAIAHAKLMRVEHEEQTGRLKAALRVVLPMTRGPKDELETACLFEAAKLAE